jgi:hypothetical protein
MKYAIEKWKQHYWKVYVYSDEGERILEVASLYTKSGLYVNGTLANPQYGALFLVLAYRLADASAGGSNVATVREVIEDVLGG